MFHAEELRVRTRVVGEAVWHGIGADAGLMITLLHLAVARENRVVVA
jgi:hypothetical protein